MFFFLFCCSGGVQGAEKNKRVVSVGRLLFSAAASNSLSDAANHLARVRHAHRCRARRGRATRPEETKRERERERDGARYTTLCSARLEYYTAWGCVSLEAEREGNIWKSSNVRSLVCFSFSCYILPFKLLRWNMHVPSYPFWLGERERSASVLVV